MIDGFVGAYLIMGFLSGICEGYMTVMFKASCSSFLC